MHRLAPAQGQGEHESRQRRLVKGVEEGERGEDAFWLPELEE